MFNIITNNSGEIHAEKIYSKIYPVGVTTVKFVYDNTLMLVGMDNGSIIVIKIFVTEKANVSRELVDEYCAIKAHKSKVLKISMDTSSGYIFSIAKEGNFVISEVNYHSVMKSIPISKSLMTGMHHIEAKGLILLSDDKGSLWVIDVSQPVYIYPYSHI